MNSDDKAGLAVIAFWAVVIITLVFGVLKAGEFIWVKTANIVSSYEKEPNTEETKVVKIGKKDKVNKSKSEKKKSAIKKDDLFFNTDGTLRDPVPNDGYTAAQNYWFLIMCLIAVFVMWAGCLSRNPIVYLIFWILGFVLAIYFVFA